MHAYAPGLVLAATTDSILMTLLAILGLLVGLVIALYNGRNPSQLRLDRHRDHHKLDDEAVALGVLAEIDECLRRQDYRSAHDYMLSHTNWFFLHRIYLPTDFTNAWLALRNRINRILSIQNYRQGWAERSLMQLQEDALQLIQRAAIALGGTSLEEMLRAEDPEPAPPATATEPGARLRNLTPARP